MLKLNGGSHSIKKFNTAHPALVTPATDGFFASSTLSELQEYVDNTWKMRKKLFFSSPTNALIAQAKGVLELVYSENSALIFVRWGVHQSELVSDEIGKIQHFTVIGDPNDWHFYIKSDGKRLAYISNGPLAANFVTITR